MSGPSARAIAFVDTTTRDGNQSLWSATGLTTPDVLAIAPTMDRVGYDALDFTSSTHMAVSVRFHREDPWERLRLVSAAMPNTPLSIITTGMRFISWVPADQDVIAFAFRLVARNGIRRMQIADPSNDPARLRRLAAMARREGIEQVVVGLTYSISPVHTHQYYAEHAAALAGCPDMDRLYLKDPGGLLTVDAVRELAPHFVNAAGGRTVELHSHCTIGLAPLVYVEGVNAGFQVVHTASGPLSRGTSQPEVLSTVRNLEASGYSHELDLEAEAVVAEHFHRLARAKGLPPGAPREFDAVYYHHQLPGGMVTTTRRMLEELRRPELFDRVLEEVTRVRAEMGYPILVTPVSQFVASQAARNVIDPERWANVSDETVRYFLGHYGEPPAPVDPDIAERVLSRPQARKLRDLEPITLEGARGRFGRRISEEDLLLRLTMPAEQVDAMVKERGRPLQTFAPSRTGGHSPLVNLLRELATRSAISEFEPRGTATAWCGAVLDGLLEHVRGFVFDVDGTLAHRGPDGRAQPQPGAVEVLERIRASGRSLVLFTNGSHVPAEAMAQALREDGLPVSAREMLTPVNSAITYIRRRYPDRPALLFAHDVIRARMFAAGIPQARGDEAGVVFVAHVDAVDLAMMEHAARAVSRGAPLLTGSYARGYAGAGGIIYSRGAMVTAGIAKVTGARPRIVGKPSRAAVEEISMRLGLPAQQIAVIGDDAGMDIALGRMGGSRTVLVRSGISGAIDVAKLPERHRPDAVIDRVSELLEVL